MVEEGESGIFYEILIEGRDSISREDLLKYIRSNFEGMSLKNIESLQQIISPKQEKILEIGEDKSYLGNEVDVRVISIKMTKKKMK